MALYRPPLTARPRALVSYTRRHQGSAVLFLFALLVGVDLIRRGFPRTPGAIDGQRVVGYAGAAVAFAILAAVWPDGAALLLLFILVLAALNAAPALTAALNDVSRRLGAGRRRVGGVLER